MEYFEEFADLIEVEDTVEYEDIYKLLADSAAEDAGEIIENYFNELESGIPDPEQELFMLVENIKTGMLFLCENLEDPSTMSQLAEEIYKFRNWYVNEETTFVNGKETTVIDAIATARANKITGENADYDFTGSLNYELKDFSFSLGAFQGIDIVGDDFFEDLESTKDYKIN